MILETKYLPKQDYTIKKDTYRTGGMALLIMDGYTEAMRVSVNIEGFRCPEGHIVVKDYSENEGILDALIAAGVLCRTDTSVRSGFVNCEVCKVLSCE